MDKKVITITITIKAKEGGGSESRYDLDGIDPEMAGVFMLEIGTKILTELVFHHIGEHIPKNRDAVS